jgi:hypothetical protein
MSKIATYFCEKFFMGNQAEIYAEHYKSRNVWSDYSGSIGDMVRGTIKKYG